MCSSDLPLRRRGRYDEVTNVTDDRHDERPDRPAWAVVPTMPWSRVQPSERRDTGTATSGQRQREYLPDEDEDSDDREAREEYRRRDEYREREDTEEEGGYRPRRAAPEEDQVDHLGRRRAPDPDGQRGRTAEAERDDDGERESTVHVPHAPNAAYREEVGRASCRERVLTDV